MISAVMAALTAFTPQWQAVRYVGEPFTSGYECGVSAMFAGCIGDNIVVAGGANFPNEPVWEGGKKEFYGDIYIHADGNWHYAGQLPQPLAYGMTAPAEDRLLFIGGAGTSGAVTTVTAVSIASDGTARLDEMAPLPVKLQEGAATSCGHTVYVAGGVADGRPSDMLMALDLSSDKPSWRMLSRMPEALVQPIMACSGGKLYLWGGCNPAEGTVSGKGYAYDPATDSWTPITGHPEGGTFTGATAVTLPNGDILCLGGVDREVFTPALKYTGPQIREYQTRPVEAYRFQRVNRIYSPATDSWHAAGEAVCVARAGASAVCTTDGIWLMGGELKPGIRTPEAMYAPLP